MLHGTQAADVVAYYDECEIDYKLRWHLRRSHAMHFGFWDEHVRTLPEALDCENQILARLANITSKSHVLDAGCGVGGSAVFLAQTYGCHVTGITLSKRQVREATRYAARSGVAHNTNFVIGDYCTTDLPNCSFDTVLGIESVCHAPNKGAFVAEAFRLLRPGGRLVVADFFATQRGSILSSHSYMRRWLSGWAVPDLVMGPAMNELAIRAGFSNAHYGRVTSLVWPSARQLFYTSLATVPLSRAGELLGIRTPRQTANQVSVHFQYRALLQDLWEYGILLATK